MREPKAMELQLEQLRQMIGIRVLYRDIPCLVHEILEDGPSLVLMPSDLEDISIQADQHGEAHRRVRNTYTVPVLSPDFTEFSSAFLALDPLD
ncbi:MAG: hypothetical protein OEZ47_08445 [Gammaproteobacteria bacterium]|nr:hypothetical protein [Gammaproteobacteria bacterium]